MNYTMLKGKIHRAVVKQADLNYVGSITVDTKLLEAAGIMEYKGDFKDNYFEGEGTLIIYNGSTYTGQFYHDKYHGKGVITTTIKKENSKPIEQKFDGTFDNGVGKGTYYLGDGNKLIEVTWKNNKLKDGECIKVYPQGNKERGYWKEGHFTAK